MNSPLLKAAAMAGGLSLLFSQGAGAVQAPVLFPQSDSPFTHTVNGCTADGALMEVQFSFEFDPHYARDYLNTDEQINHTIELIDNHVADVLTPLWRETLAGLDLAQIETGQAQPLRPLLDGLYSFTDHGFANQSEGAENGDILPVLRSGIYEENHIICMK